jgi:hypothetical protein
MKETYRSARMAFPNWFELRQPGLSATISITDHLIALRDRETTNGVIVKSERVMARKRLALDVEWCF